MKKIIAFDFDDTLCKTDGTPNEPMLEILRNHANLGHKCYIVTSRNREHESKKWIAEHQPDRIRVKDFVKEYNLPVKQCHFTNHELKGPYLSNLKVSVFYDDNLMHLESARSFGIEAIESLATKS